jgi:ABC-type dipeptide/oligopeptide/nickel transport system permease component
MLAAVKKGGWQDTVLGGVFVAFWSIPTVWAGVMCLGYLCSSQYLRLFPTGGIGNKDNADMLFLPVIGVDGFERGFVLDALWHVALPVFCLVYGGFAILSKQTRAAMLENFSADYVRTAKAKGVAGRDVIFQHVFRNSLLPLITMFATIFPAMLAGSVVIERIFSVPGMGSLVIEAINLRDREVLLANTLIIAAVNLLALLLADVLYALCDPRISYK